MSSEVKPYNGPERSAVAEKKLAATHRNGANGATTTTAPIPWQERPAGSKAVLWRHTANPVIGRHHIPGVQGIYNSAVAPYGDGFVGVFRLETTNRFPHLHLGWSDDGLDWHIEPKPIEFASGDPGEASDYATTPAS
jgi:beta-1,4-mannooligosaccharide/beta-1,4-mannosyl-N-acetylglucosamine phosphorylase